LYAKRKGEDCRQEGDGDAGLGRLADCSPGTGRMPAEKLDECFKL
jgi:hypothetical protein